ENFSNLQTVGRNGLHRYNNQDHSMLTAVYAARNIVGERNDVWSVNTEMEYHEEARMKDGTSAPTGDRPAGDRLTPMRAPAPAMTPDEVIEAVFAKLDPVALGAALGVVSALTLFLASATLLLKGGSTVGPTLSLLGQFLIGFEVTWKGS